jgi:hypothetical protein
MEDIDPFEQLEITERLLDQCKPTIDPDSKSFDYAQLKFLLAHERMLDYCRNFVLDKYESGSDESEDYKSREQMVRHRISEFALKIDEKLTSKLSEDEDSYDQSALSMYIKDRQIYPAEPEYNS